MACERMDNVESMYPNFEAAIKANAVGKGRWVPEFLPPSSTNIYEKHNLDTNEQWLSFKFAGDIASIVNSCEQSTIQQIMYPRRSPGKWWPQTFLQNFDNHMNTNYIYYKCKENGFIGIMAINIEKGEGYYWLLINFQ